ncbi:MAG: endonuclease MutS2 [bacterium]
MQIADEITLRALEWGKIKDLLRSLCLTPMGRERVEGLVPSTEIETVRASLKETEEAIELLRCSPPLRETIDVEPLIKRAEKDGTLQEEELLKLREFLSLSHLLKEFILERKDSIPCLARIARRIPEFTSLIETITSVVSEEGKIRDNASERMRDIRENIRNLTKLIQKKLEDMLNSPAIQKYLQDRVITLREGRFCLAVKREYGEKVEGIVHSTSASGATLFIEPITIVREGNRLRQLEKEEEEERGRILRRLSKIIKEKANFIERAREAVGLIDFCLAKGELALRLNAFPPSLNENGVLRLKEARHPLLPQNVAVPVSLEMNRQKRALIITGPNTGGKTTTLKMVGLLAYMTQCGLFIPASEESTLPIFESILADIGEEQSIEQSLSTFSSHINQIKRILDNIKGLSLVLLDELGAGTDPAEGSALARAIVEYLSQKENVLLIVATHFSELKLLPFLNPVIRGASFEFDPISLKPTFKLVMDAIGRSHAIEVAQRLGLEEGIIGRAKEIIDYSQPYGELLAEIEEERRALREEREKARELREEYEEKLRELEEEKERILANARREAEEFLRDVRERVEAILKEKKERKEKRDEWRKVWEKVRGEEAPPFKIGERVLVGTIGREGSVVDIKGERLLVDVEGKKMLVHPSQLIHLGERKEEKPAMSSYIPISPLVREVNLRGMSVEEALYELDKEIDRAYFEGVKRLRVIHGKGRGILRKAVWDFLKEHKLVRSFQLADVREGSYGATIVELKQED